MQRLSRVITLVRAMLIQMQLAIKGEVVLTSELQGAMLDLFNAKRFHAAQQSIETSLLELPKNALSDRGRTLFSLAFSKLLFALRKPELLLPDRRPFLLQLARHVSLLFYLTLMTIAR